MSVIGRRDWTTAPGIIVSIWNNIMVDYSTFQRPTEKTIENHVQFRGISYDTAIKIAPLDATKEIEHFILFTTDRLLRIGAATILNPVSKMISTLNRFLA